MANWDPLKLGELTLGDYLRQIGMPAIVVGKSEGSPNNTAIDRFNIDIASKTGQLLANNGFLPYEIFLEQVFLYNLNCFLACFFLFLTLLFLF